MGFDASVTITEGASQVTGVFQAISRPSDFITVRAGSATGLPVVTFGNPINCSRFRELTAVPPQVPFYSSNSGAVLVDASDRDPQRYLFSCLLPASPHVTLDAPGGNVLYGAADPQEVGGTVLLTVGSGDVGRKRLRITVTVSGGDTASQTLALSSVAIAPAAVTFGPPVGAAIAPTVEFDWATPRASGTYFADDIASGALQADLGVALQYVFAQSVHRTRSYVIDMGDKRGESGSARLSRGIRLTNSSTNASVALDHQCASTNKFPFPTVSPSGRQNFGPCSVSTDLIGLIYPDGDEPMLPQLGEHVIEATGSYALTVGGIDYVHNAVGDMFLELPSVPALTVTIVEDTQPTIDEVTTPTVYRVAQPVDWSPPLFSDGNGDVSAMYSIMDGVANLPDGLVFNPDTGAVTGTPREVGEFTFLMEVTDSDNEIDGQGNDVTSLSVPFEIQPNNPPTLTVTSETVSAAEGANVEIVVRVAPISSVTLQIPYTLATTEGASSSESADFADAGTGTITVDPNTPNGTISVSLVSDTRHEADEVFLVELGAATGDPPPYELDAASVASVTIEDDDDVPGIRLSATRSRIREVSSAEAEPNPNLLNEINSDVSFVLTGGTTYDDVVTIPVVFSGRASRGFDWKTVPNTLASVIVDGETVALDQVVFDPGQTLPRPGREDLTVPFYIAAIDDIQGEDDEVITIRADVPDEVEPSPRPAPLEITIQDNDGGAIALELEIGPTTTVTEGDGATPITFTISQANLSSPKQVAILAEQRDSSAESDDFFRLPSFNTNFVTISLSPTSSTKFHTLALTVRDDNIVEDEEELVFNTITGGQYDAGAATLTVREADPPDMATVNVSAPPGSVAEGGMLVYTVTLDQEVESQTRVSWELDFPEDGSGADENDVDEYAGTAVFPASSNDADAAQTYVVRIPVTDDFLTEEAEEVTISLGTPETPDVVGLASRVSVVTSTAVATIAASDPPVTVGFPPVPLVIEENLPITARVAVTLNPPPQRDFDIPITVVERTASEGDYTLFDTSVSFASGVIRASISFTITNDELDDDNESFVLGFGPELPNGVVTSGVNGTIRVNIQDDDVTPLTGPSAPLTVSAGPVTGPDGRFTMTVGWDRPANSGGSTVTSYLVRHWTAADVSGESTTHIGTMTITGADPNPPPLSATITDLEHSTTYSVEVRAVGDPLPVGYTTVWSAVASGATRVNNDPAFRQTKVSVEVAENTTASIPLSDASDLDRDTLTYRFKNATDVFQLNTSDAVPVLESNAPLNFEDLPPGDARYEVTIVADDALGGTDELPVTVEVIDEDEPPSPPTSVGLAATGLTVTWSAPVSGLGGPPYHYQVRYRSKLGAITSSYTLARVDQPATTFTPTGLIVPSASYEFDVRTRNDEGASEWLAAGTRTGENTVPAFPGDAETMATIPENSPAGTAVGSPIEARDPDLPSETLVHSLLGADAVSFTIESGAEYNTPPPEGDVVGQIRVATGADLDFETKSLYLVTLSAVDVLGATVTHDLVISLSDISPAFSADASLTVTVAENSPAGTAVGTPIEATDPDFPTVTFVHTLSGDDASAFVIESGTAYNTPPSEGDVVGQIRVAAGADLDFEAKSSYTVTINAVESGDDTDTHTLAIELRDQRLPPPTEVTASAVSNTELLVGWTAPVTDFVIANYTVSYAAVPDPATTTMVVGSETSVTVTGLTPDTEYSISVVAGGPEGASTAAAGPNTRTGKQGTFGLDPAAVNVAEGGTAIIRVTTDVAIETEVELELAIRIDSDENTADADSDDYGSTSPISDTFPADTTSFEVEIDVDDDNLAEFAEVFVVELTSVELPATATGTDRPALGSSTMTPVTIAESDPVNLAITGPASIDETDTAASSYQVALTGGDLADDASLDVGVVASGTAGKGSDYTISAESLTFNQAGRRQSFTIDPIDDSIAEPTETIEIALSVPDGVVPTGTVGNAEISLTDDDAVTVNADRTQFNIPTASPAHGTHFLGGEGAGATSNREDKFAPVSRIIEVPVTLSAPPGRRVTIPYYVTGANLVEGEDYLVEFPVFEATDTSSFLKITALYDGDSCRGEYDDMFTLPPDTSARPGNGNCESDETVVGETGSESGFFLIDRRNPQFPEGVVPPPTPDSSQPDREVQINFRIINNPNELGTTVTLGTDTTAITEGDTANVEVSVTLLGSTLLSNRVYDWEQTRPPKDVTVMLNFTPGEQASIAAPARVIIPAHEYSGSVNIAMTATDDELATGDRTVKLGGTGQIDFNDGEALMSLSVQTVGILIEEDDNPEVSVITADVAVAEPGTAELTVSLSRPVSVPVTVTYSTVDDSATAGSDYTAVSTEVTFTATETGEKTFNIAVTDDNLSEGEEEFQVTIAATAVGVELMTVTDGDIATVTIAANDPLDLTISGPASVTQGETATYEVGLAGNIRPVGALVLPMDVAGAGTTPAVEGTHFNDPADTVTIPDGSASAQFEVVTPTDDAATAPHFWTVAVGFGDLPADTLGGFTSESADREVVTEIRDDRYPPVEVSFAQASRSVNEGESVTVRVNLSQAPVQEVTVPVTVSTAGDAGAEDHAFAGTDVVIAGTETSATFVVATREDDSAEGDETLVLGIDDTGFHQDVSAPAPGTVAIIIVDDDTAPTSIALAVSGGPRSEGATAGEVTFEASFTDTGVKTLPTALAIPLAFAGTAEDADYTLPLPVLVIPAGMREGSASAMLTIHDDSIVEGDEAIVVTAAIEGYTIAQAEIAITSDADTAEVSLSGPAANIDEDTADPEAVFTVTLSQAVEDEVVVSLTTNDDTAVAGEDYTAAASGAGVTFAGGSAPGATRLFTVDVTNDAFVEVAEAFDVSVGPVVPNFSDRVSVATAGTVAVATIGESDPVMVSLRGPSHANEGSNAPYTVVLTGGDRTVDLSVSVTVETTDATPGTDFTEPTFTSVTVAMDADERQFFIPVLNDDSADDDRDETITVVISNPSGVSGPVVLAAADSSVATTLGVLPTVRFRDASLSTDESGPSIGVTATIDAPFGAQTTLRAMLVGGDAVIEDDTATPRVRGDFRTNRSNAMAFVFAAGGNNAAFNFEPKQDAIDEGDEKAVFGFVPSSIPAGYVIGSPSRVTVTIVDDDTVSEDISFTASTVVGEAGVSTLSVSEYNGFPNTVMVTLTATRGGGTALDTDQAIPLAVGTVAEGAGRQASRDTGDNPVNRDFQVDLPTLTIPADSATGTVEFVLTLFNNNIVELEETVVITSPVAGHTITPLEVAIQDRQTLTQKIIVSPVLGNTETGDEGETFSVQVFLPSAVDSEVLAAVETMGGDQSDFEWSDEALTFPAGVAGTIGFDVTRRDDDLFEGEETLQVRFVPMPDYGGRIEPSNFSTVTIRESDPIALSLAGPEETPREGTAAVFTVHVTGGRPSDVVTFNVAASPASGAVAGTDYGTVPSTGTIAAEATFGTFSIPLTDDGEIDVGEQIAVTISSPTGGYPGHDGSRIALAQADSSVTTDIGDANTPTVVVGFAESAIQVTEGDASVAVTLTGSYDTELGRQFANTVSIPVSVVATGTAMADELALGVLPAEQSGSEAGYEEYSFDISAVEDMLEEGEETLELVIGDLGDGTAQGRLVEGTNSTLVVTILNGLAASREVTVASSAASHAENAGAVDIPVTVSLGGSVARSTPLEVPIALGSHATEPNAVVDVDYSLRSPLPVLTIPAGSLSMTGQVDVSINDDSLIETDKVALLTATVEEHTVTPLVLSITDNETAQVGIFGPTVDEPASGAGSAVFMVELGGNAGINITVTLSTTAGTAAEGSDYTGRSGSMSTVVFTNGYTAGTQLPFTVEILPDDLSEGDEGFNLVVEDVSPDFGERLITSALGAAVIRSNDPLTVAFSNPPTRVNEGETASYPITVTGGESTAPVEIEFEVTSDTATDPDDYMPPDHTTITIAEGESTAMIDIPIVTDGPGDPNESLTVRLTAVSGGSDGGEISLDPVASNVSVETAIQDEVSGGFTPGTYTVSEAEGSREASVPLTLDVEPGREVRIAISSSSTTGAEDGIDYTVSPAEVTFAADQTSRDVVVAAIDDDLAETVEEVVVTASAGGLQSSVTVTITDDDTANVGFRPTPPALAFEAFDIPYTLTVTLDRPVPAADVTVAWSATEHAADLVESSGSVVIMAGGQTATFTVRALDDDLAEPTETVTIGIDGATIPDSVTLANPIGVPEDTDEQSFLISDSDVLTLAIEGPATVTEGAAPNAVYTVSVTGDTALGGDLALTGTVFAPLDASVGAKPALHPVDYMQPAVATILEGGTSVMIPVPIVDDEAYELVDEIMVFRVRTFDGVTDVAGYTAPPFGNPLEVTTTIVDDDNVSVSFVPLTVAALNEGDGGTPAGTVVVTVTLNQTVDHEVVVEVVPTERGGATGVDYFLSDRFLTFPEYATVQMLSVGVVDDIEDDDGESLRLGLRIPLDRFVPGTTPEVEVSFVDDDEPPPYHVGFQESGVIGNEGNAVEVEVGLSEPLTVAASVPWGASQNADDLGPDPSPMIEFAAGETVATLTVTIADDTLSEMREEVVITLGDPVPGGSLDRPLEVVPDGDDLLGPEITVTIRANDPLTVSLSGPDGAEEAVTEGDDATYTLAVTGGVGSENVEVTMRVVPVVARGTEASDISVADSTITEPGPGNPPEISAVVTILAGMAEGSFVVGIVDDDEDDDGERFRVSISGVSGGGGGTVESPPADPLTSAGGSLLTHIEDNDFPAARVSFVTGNNTLVEGETGVALVTLSVAGQSNPERDVEVPITLSYSGGASADDISLSTETLTFGADSDGLLVLSYEAVDDRYNESAAEGVTLGFGELPEGVTEGGAPTLGIEIRDNDVIELIRLASVLQTLSEAADSGVVTVAVEATFEGTVVRDRETAVTLTLGGTAERDADYAIDTSSGPIVVPIPASMLAGTLEFPVTLIDDDVVELDEFIVLGASPPDFSVFDHTITVTSDDTAEIAISGPDPDALGVVSSESYPVRVFDINTGQFGVRDVPAVPAEFTVSLSNPVVADVVVTLAASDGSAILGADYALPDTLEVTIAAHPAASEAVLTVTVLEDTVNEGDEDFSVSVTSFDAVLTVTVPGDPVDEGDESGPGDESGDGGPGDPVDEGGDGGDTGPGDETGDGGEGGEDTSPPVTTIEFDLGDMITLPADTAATATIPANDPLDLTISGDDSVTQGDDIVLTVGYGNDNRLPEGAALAVPVTAAATNLPSSFPPAATLGTHYRAIVSEVTIPENGSTVDLTVETIGNDVNDPGAGWRLTVGVGTPLPSVGGGYTDGAADAEKAFLIADDRYPAVGVSFRDESATVAEGGVVDVTITLTGPTEGPLDIPVTVGAGATNPAMPEDYTLDTVTVEVAGAETSVSFPVAAAPDSDPEGFEVLRLAIDGTGFPPDVALGSRSSIDVTITDSDAVRVGFAPGPHSVAEAAGSSVTVAVSLGAVRSATTEVTVVDSSGSGAARDVDYTISPTVLVFDPGETTIDVVVTTRDDNIDEGNEVVTLSFGTVTRGVVPGGPVEVTIVDDDVSPGMVGLFLSTLSITPPATPGESAVFTPSPVSTVEETGSGAPVPFELAARLGGDITRSEDLTVTVTVDPSSTARDTEFMVETGTYQEDGTFVAGPSHDGSDLTLTVVIPSGSLTGAVSFRFSAHEGDDTTVRRAEPVDTIVFAGAAPGRPAIDVSSVALSLVDATAAGSVYFRASGNVTVVTVSEGADDPELLFRVHSRPGINVTVPWTVTVGGDDLEAYGGSVVVTGGGNGFGTVVVPVVDDVLLEETETVVVELRAPTSTPPLSKPYTVVGPGIDNQAASMTVVIEDDDARVATFEAADYSTDEATQTPATVWVTLNGMLGDAVALPIVDTSPSGAVRDADYGISSNEIVFAAGETRASVVVTALNDDVDDDDETVVLAFGTLPDEVVAGTPATEEVAIADDDDPRVAVAFEEMAYSAEEGGAAVEVTLTLDAVPEREVSVTVTAAPGGGAVEMDYSLDTTVAVFGAGDTTATIAVTANDDIFNDPGESVELAIDTASLPDRVSPGTPASEAVEIVDNDAEATDIAFSATTTPAGPIAEAAGEITVTLTAGLVGSTAVEEDLEFSVTIRDDADAAEHAAVAAVPVTIAAGELSGTREIPVVLTDDDTVEPDRRIVVDIDGALAGYTIAPATVAVADDDTATVSVEWVDPGGGYVAEGDDALLRFVLDAPVAADVGVPWGVDFSGAVDAGDFGPEAGGTLDFGDAGTSAAGTMTLSLGIAEDGVFEDAESVSVTLGAPEVSDAGLAADVTLGTAGPVVFPVAFNAADRSTVNISGPQATEYTLGDGRLTSHVDVVEGQAATFTLSLSGGVGSEDISVPVFVGEPDPGPAFDLGGGFGGGTPPEAPDLGHTAQPEDYTEPASPVTIPAGSRTVTFELATRGGDSPDAGEVAVVSVDEDGITGGAPNQLVVAGVPEHAGVTIVEPNGAPAYDADSTISVTLPENTGSITVAAVDTADPEGHPLTYRILDIPFDGDTDPTLFTVDSGGTVSVAPGEHLDETRPDLTVTIEALDGRDLRGIPDTGADTSIVLEVAVTDVDEPPLPVTGLAAGIPPIGEGGHTRVAVSWTAAGPEAAPPITYEVQVRRADGVDADYADVPQAGTDPTVTVTGLTPETGYLVRVRGRNDEDGGGGEWTVLGAAVTTRANTPPVYNAASATREVEENAAAGGAVGAPIPPDVNDADALTYTLTGDRADVFGVNPADGQVTVVLADALDFEALEAGTGTVFSLTLEVEDEFGLTDAIGLDISVTDTNEPPGAPGNFSVDSTTSSTRLTLSWDEPVNTGPSLRYEFFYRETGAPSYIGSPVEGYDVTHTVGETVATIGGLEPDTGYDVAMRGTNDEGDGDLVQAQVRTGSVPTFRVPLANGDPGLSFGHPDALVLFYSLRFGNFLRANPRLLTLVYNRLFPGQTRDEAAWTDVVLALEELDDPGVVPLEHPANVYRKDGSGLDHVDALMMFYSIRFGNFLLANPRLLNLVFNRLAAVDLTDEELTDLVRGAQDLVNTL